MRLEVQSVDKPDDFLTSFQLALQEQVGEVPKLNGCPTLRVNVHKPSEDELDQKFALQEANPNSCLFFTFDLYDTTGRKQAIPHTLDGTLRGYHYLLGDGTLQFYFDDLPGFDGTATQKEEYAASAAKFIFAHLAN